MKKLSLYIILTIILLIPAFVYAQGIIKSQGDIVVNNNEEIRGDIRLGRGNITIFGKVYGNVIVLKGNIYLKENSFIKGDVITYNGKIDIEKGVTVLGRRIEFPPKSDKEQATNLSIPLIFLSKENLLLKVAIILIVTTFSLLFLILCEKTLMDVSSFFSRNILCIIPLSIITSVFFLFIIPKEAIFPFGRSIYLIYILTLITIGLFGVSILVYKIGNFIFSLLKKEKNETIGDKIVSTIIGILIVFILIILPKIGFIFLGFFALLSFGLFIIYMFTKIFKS